MESLYIIINSFCNFKVPMSTCAEMFQTYLSSAFEEQKICFYTVMAFSNLEIFQVLIITG